MNTRITLFFTFIFIAFALKAVNVEQEPTTITQPDGSSFNVFVTGDEYFHWLHDAEGYTLCLEPDGYFYYALSAEGENWIASPHKIGSVNPASVGLKKWVSPSKEYLMGLHPIYKSADALQGKSMTNGSSVAVVILIRFSDQDPFTEDYLTKLDTILSGVNTKSVYKFYQEVSFGKLSLKSYIVRDTYVDSQPRKYFLPYNATTNPIGYKDKTEKQSRRGALLNAAVKYISNKLPAGMDHDMNKDGKLDFVSFVIRGNAGAWGDLLWPHASSGSFNNATVNGLKFGKYNFLLESKTNGIGTFTHEFYHNMGAPDVYHYTGNGINPAPNMFADNSHMSVYYKWKHSDGTWVKDIPTITKSGVYTIYPSATTDNFGTKKSAYKIFSPYDPKEFFVIEFRKKDPNTMDNVDKTGMLVYRINPTLNGNGGGPPDEVYVYRKNGTPKHDGDKKSIYFGQDLDLEILNDNTFPSPWLTNGFPGGLNIDSVGFAGDSIQFKINITPKTEIFGGGFYSIKNWSSAKLLEDKENGMACNAELTDSTNQWILDYLGNGMYKIINQKSKKVLTIPGNNPNAGATLIAQDYSGAQGQKWYLFGAGTNLKRIVSTIDKDICVESFNGLIRTVKYNAASKTHQWVFERNGNTIESDIPYLIVTKLTGHACETGTAGKLITNKLDKAKASQQWTFETVDGKPDYVYIKSKSNNSYLGSMNNMPMVVSKILSIQWNIQNNSNGTVSLLDNSKNKALSINEAGDFTLVDRNETSAQNFIFFNVANFKSEYVEPEYPPVTLADLHRDLFIYLPFENEVSNEVNNDEFEVNIEVKGNPTFQLGKRGNSLNFNGISDYLLAETQAAFNPSEQSITVSLWVYNTMDAADANRIILQQDNGDNASVGRSIMYYGVKSDAYESYLGASTYISGTGNLSANRNKWSHVALVSDVEKRLMTFVVDGKVESEVPFSKDIEWCNGNLLFGTHKDFTANRYFKGKMDEVTIHKRALNPAEIRALMDDGLNTMTGTNTATLNAQELMVYPNPASNSIRINQPNYNGKQYIISNIQGQKIASGILTNQTLNVSQLNNGLYFFTIIHEKGIHTATFNIMRNK